MRVRRSKPEPWAPVKVTPIPGLEGLRQMLARIDHPDGSWTGTHDSGLWPDTDRTLKPKGKRGRRA